ncbi:MAG: hypothetical protein AB7O73_08985 [Bacteroidia bacterium]
MNKKREIKRKKIISQFARTRSIFGFAARSAVGNVESEESFILECYEQCDTIGFQEFIGKQLFDEINDYCFFYHSLPKTDFRM